MKGHNLPQSPQTHEDAPTTSLDDKVEYLCHQCKKWYKLKDYSIKDFMCKKCLKVNK